MKRLIHQLILMSLTVSLFGQASAADEVSLSIKAVSYTVNGGSTEIDMKPTQLAPQAGGRARVEAKKGVTNFELQVKIPMQPSALGSEFLTYVVWAVSPEGRTSNVGEMGVEVTHQPLHGRRLVSFRHVS